MTIRGFLIASRLAFAFAACAVAQPANIDPRRPQKPAGDAAVESMAVFERLTPGEWRRVFANGTTMLHTWRMGPGGHSLHETTEGNFANGEPWRALRILYWHPARKQVRLLGIDPFERSVMEGEVKSSGESARADVDLFQTKVRRRIRFLWTFGDRDAFTEQLLEATDGRGYAPLAEWKYVRNATPAPARPRLADATAKPSERLKPLLPFVGKTWTARGASGAGKAFESRSTFDWIPLVDAIHARVFLAKQGGGEEHLLDAFLFHHTGTNRLRCLALSQSGAVYEGEPTAPQAGAVQVDLKGYDSGGAVACVARFDFENPGTLRSRLWSLKGAERTVVLDVHHRVQAVKQSGR